MEVTFYAFGEEGSRVQSVVINGKPLDLQEEYLLCACEREGDPLTTLCRLPKVKDPKNTPFTLHQVMREYLAANSPVSPVPRGSAKALDAPVTLLTQVSGVSYSFR